MSGATSVGLDSLLLPGMYRDSVSLMLLASQLQQLPGVERAGVVMATPANLEILAAAGMLPYAVVAAPDDLLIVVRTTDADAAASALAFASDHVSSPDTGSSEQRDEIPAATVIEGCAAMPDASLLSVSTPGAYAPLLVKQGLLAGLHVFCFSDNVDIADEVALKRLAVSRNLLLMGPDCGTSLVDGVPLGFVNAVATGPVGIVSASGTGAQEVMCQLDALGVGVSQVIGVGGRDLSAAVGGIMTSAALDLLAGDDDTDCIVIVGKPPAPAVAAKLLSHVAALAKPVVICLIGSELEATTANAVVAVTLADAAAYAARLVGAEVPLVLPHDPEVMPAAPASGLLGLYAGGTLAAEARHLLHEFAVEGQVLDLGDDEFTVGRPHPMIDPSLRCERIETAGGDASVRVLLVDLVLGLGASPDPATPLAAAVARAKASAARDGRVLAVVASICGTVRDPQGMEAQRQTLIEAGVIIGESNAAAVSIAAQLIKAGA
ncbi:MAG: acyl-CoA synthetase FdrA [Candidatus Nanopelagicales bacterium]|nr:acyl-CoA synthetase FdrA [Candidatus Nanopelagicales bacterium]